MSSILEQEIYSQPPIMAHLLERETKHIEQIIKQLPPFDYVLIAARGSSDHAATYAKYVWATLASYPVALAAPSLQTLYKISPRMAGALLVGISQSGQSPDIIAVLEEGKRQGRPTLAITNDGTSPLAATADHVVELHAGPERSIAATKTYTAQLAVMALFAAFWSGDRDRLASIQSLPQALEITLQGASEIAQRVERYRYMDRCVIIGRGYNYATSFELALKLKELTYVMASSYSSADFRHGPIATVENGLPVFLIMTAGASLGPHEGIGPRCSAWPPQGNAYFLKSASKEVSTSFEALTPCVCRKYKRSPAKCGLQVQRAIEEEHISIVAAL